MSEILSKAGQFELGEVTLLQANGDTINITEQVDKVFINEDLYSPFMSGKIFFRDTLDLPGMFGRSGRDLIYISAWTPTIDQSRRINSLFFVYKTSERVELGHRMKGYYYYIISAEKLGDLQQLSRAFSGTAESIIREIAGRYFETKKPLLLERSIGQMKFVSNFWKPTDCISFITERAVGGFSTEPDMLFFENRDGFNLRSFRSMASDSAIATFSNYDFSARIDTTPANFGAIIPDVQKDYSTIIEFVGYSQYDSLRTFDFGGIRNVAIAYDPIRKEYRKKEFALGREYKPALNKNLHFRNDVINATSPVTIPVSKVFGTNDMGDGGRFSSIGKRRALLDNLKNGIIEIEVYGRTDYTVGKKVRLDMSRDMPISREDGLSETFSEMYSGNYLITAVLHSFERGLGHLCSLELRKESTVIA